MSPSRDTGEEYPHVADYAHPVGTCRMGSSPPGGAVVDARANTNFTCYVVGMTIARVLASRP